MLNVCLELLFAVHVSDAISSDIRVENALQFKRFSKLTTLSENQIRDPEGSRSLEERNNHFQYRVNEDTCQPTSRITRLCEESGSSEISKLECFVLRIICDLHNGYAENMMTSESIKFKIFKEGFYSHDSHFEIDPKVAFPRRTHPKVRDIYTTPALEELGTREMTVVAFEAAANFTSFTHEKLLWPGSQVLKDKPDCGQEVAKGQTWALKVY
ncbi:hypothetical protein K0M31_000476 [Melipona bicolor]|uniref:Uncharacterized protein n=1 Tax=Melipona bicolor TaxID=60889 RepID=A0AA40KWP8_9HYME|nr:hypothetical protein K0M31_000476 [Melipona bicolor]